MALSIEQIAAVSYPAVLAEARKPENQWVENAAMRMLEEMGFIKRINFGENIEVPLDYRPNPDIAILANDQDQFPLIKTEVITSAVYEIAQLSEPVTWTKGDDAKNPTENQKIDFVKHLLTNAIDSHDDKIEQTLFTTSTVGGVELNGLDTLVPTTGLGTVGGINASAEVFWRNPVDTYSDASDIEAALTAIWNECIKGTGSSKKPKVVLSGSEPQVLYEVGLQALQRFIDTKEADAGFTALAFKTAKWVFSQYGGDNVYLVNPSNFQLVVSKQYFRDKGKTNEVQGQNAFYFLLYSALQMLTNNKSRLGVLSLS